MIAVEDSEAGDLPLRWEGEVIPAAAMPPLHGGCWTA